ncbi:hypothetical protein GCM10011329_23590 [Stakelama pacifica]|nr:hypothetical protein GCM10011329_23590 [Stakelama pacifica]
MRIGENRIGREQDHRGLEQIIVKGPEKLRDEQWQKSALSQQAKRAYHRKSWALNGMVGQP